MNWGKIRSDAKEIKEGIKATDGGIVIKAPYNKAFIAELKALPKSDRSWDDNGGWEKFWFIADASADKATALYEKYFGAVEAPNYPTALNEGDRLAGQSIRSEIAESKRRHVCPDCGRTMTNDNGMGGYYCEYCEG